MIAIKSLLFLESIAAKEKLEIVKVQDFGSEFRGGISSPPQAAKIVRANLRIVHTFG